MSHHSKWKEFWFSMVPVRKGERLRFILMLLVFFLLTFVYDLLRPLKSALVIADPKVGTELIPYIKVWGVLPGAFFLTTFVMKLGHIFSREKVFYLMMAFYIGFFSLFLTVIYPWRESLELTWFAQWLRESLPFGKMNHMATLFEKWYLVLFYTLTELWGNILLSMLFWGFSNEINTVDEARRFYPLFLLGANSAAIFSGSFGRFFSQMDSVIPYGVTSWDQSLFFFLITAILGAFGIMVLFWVIHILHPHLASYDRAMIPPTSSEQGSETKVRLTILQCLNYVCRNPYLGCLALIVFGYNLVFNISDILWTHELSKVFQGDINGYARYTSSVTTVTGVISVFISLFVTSRLLRFGWRYAALLTPLSVTLCALGFFFCLNFPYAIGGILGNPVEVTLLLGTMEMAISRGAKYTVFDTTKEMAFIPLSPREQRLGKAVIDGIGSRLGKSSGSFIFQMLFLMMTSLDDMIPVMTGIVFFTLALWIFATIVLARFFQTAS